MVFYLLNLLLYSKSNGVNISKSSFEILYAKCTYMINLIYSNGCYKYIKYLAKCICYFNNMQMQSACGNILPYDGHADCFLNMRKFVIHYERQHVPVFLIKVCSLHCSFGKGQKWNLTCRFRTKHKYSNIKKIYVHLKYQHIQWLATLSVICLL